jgi:hypothetical protein
MGIILTISNYPNDKKKSVGENPEKSEGSAPTIPANYPYDFDDR